MRHRRVPRLVDLRALVRVRAPAALTGVAGCLTIDDLRARARRRVPRAVFDYVDGGAEQERSMSRARAAFDRVEFLPRVLRDVAAVDLRTEILGRTAAMPVVFAPTGFTRMMHPDGEPAVAAVAARLGIPYALSTMGTTSPEALAAAAPDADRWFQLYIWRDRARSKELVARADAAGYRALVVTVDVPVQGGRLRDARNGLTIPPTLSLRTLGGMALRPRWWFNALTTDPLTFATFDESSPRSLAELIGTMFDPAVDFDDLDWLRGVWPHALVVKGVQSVPDAVELAARGVDAVVVSNHGGRQLDRAPVPFELLPAVVDAVGDRLQVLMDGGVRSGADVAAALALGARAVLVGRAYLYGLMAGGQPGVTRAAEILRTELARTLQLLGVPRLGELDRSMVRMRPT